MGKQGSVFVCVPAVNETGESVTDVLNKCMKDIYKRSRGFSEFLCELNPLINILFFYLSTLKEGKKIKMWFFSCRSGPDM